IRTSTEKSVTISELLKSLHLVGIISGENAQAIIEDKSAGQMHYLVKGDRVGDLEVIEVMDDKVRLSYGSEEAQLTL
ncbi:MAG: hypothetical protein Q8Q33_04285, partial [Chlamydiota bacterium]|nr:hypothetical protein [Chlamydiota bacterium]